jgi:hypothetical protein
MGAPVAEIMDSSGRYSVLSELIIKSSSVISAQGTAYISN